MKLSRRLTSVVSIFIGALILAGILYYIGVDKVTAQIVTLGWRGFCLLILSLVMTFVFWTLSWIVIMRGYGVDAPTGGSLGARISSFAVSYLTPSMHFGGEPVRALLIQKQSNASYTRAFASIATERIVSSLAMVCFILLGAYQGIYTQLPANTLIYLILLTVLFSALLALIILNFVNGYYFFSRTVEWLERMLPDIELLHKAKKTIRNLEDDIRKSFRTHLKHTVVAFVLNLIATFFMYIRPQIFFYFSKGSLFSFSQLSIIFALLALLSSFLWITPGGLGIVEGGMIGIFALVGAEGSDAVAYSFSIKVIELFFVGFGLAWMARFGILNLLFGGSPPVKDE